MPELAVAGRQWLPGDTRIRLQCGHIFGRALQLSERLRDDTLPAARHPIAPHGADRPAVGPELGGVFELGQRAAVEIAEDELLDKRTGQGRAPIESRSALAVRR